MLGAKNFVGGIHTPRVFAYEWQGKDLRDREFVRVAGKGLTGGHFCVFAHDGRRSERSLPPRHRDTEPDRQRELSGRGMPPPVFLKKSPQTIENKGRGHEKERQESSRGGKRKGVKEIEEATVLPPRPGRGRRLRRGHRAGLDESRDRKGAADGDGGREGSGRGRGRGGCGATF